MSEEAAVDYDVYAADKFLTTASPRTTPEELHLFHYAFAAPFSIASIERDTRHISIDASRATRFHTATLNIYLFPAMMFKRHANAAA